MEALALYGEFRKGGVNAKRSFVGNRMWVTSIVDPDGYRLDSRARPTRPEESEFSEKL